MQVTQRELFLQYHRETGYYANEINLTPYYKWLEERYLERLNEEKELNDKLTEFMLQDGEE